MKPGLPWAVGENATMTRSTETVQEVADILDHESISTWFQPVVDLVTGAVVGYEGLTRGPQESPLRMPTELFEAAREAHRLEELDWQCRLTALGGALASGMGPPLTLFMNVEPEVLSSPPDHAEPVLARAMGGLRVIVELTERALLEQPGTLLQFVETVRQAGWGLAVDDIGAHPHSLAMLSVIEPDVVKIDQPRLKAMPRTTAAALISGIQTYCRRAGARVVAEGLETDDDTETARSTGARYGQGWFYGRPSPLTHAEGAPGGPIPLLNPRAHRPTRRLIHVVTRSESAQPGTRERVNRVSGYLLDHAAELGPNTLVIICVQTMAFVDDTIRSTLQRLVGRVAHLALLGVDLPFDLVPGAHITQLSPADPLVSEWVIATIGLQEAIALVASDLGDDYNAGGDRRYEFVVTYNPQMVTDVSRALLSRMT